MRHASQAQEGRLLRFLQLRVDPLPVQAVQLADARAPTVEIAERPWPFGVGLIEVDDPEPRCSYELADSAIKVASARETRP